MCVHATSARYSSLSPPTMTHHEGEIYWGQERIDELLGQVAITKRTAVAARTVEQDERTHDIELARIQEQPVLCDYYKLMRMRLRSYFNAVSVLRSGKHG